MIFVTDKGRMANNIFQYGHLYAWGREHGRKTMSMRFAYKYHHFHICHTPYHHFLTYVLAKYAAKWGLIPTVNFTDINSDYQQEQELMLKHRHILATGWCVRFPELFLKYKEEIKELFAFDEVVKAPVDQKLKPYQGHLKLGVHIRRGDYATWCRGRYFYNDQQYLHAIQEFIRLHPDEEIDIFMCGNDPKLDKAFYQKHLGDKIHFPEGTPDEDFYLLSACDYLIGAPSTFTLVASMYKDTPLYWIIDPQKSIDDKDFETFDILFRKFDDYFIP